MSQTSINAGGQPVGIAGQDYDSGEGKDVTSWFNESATSVPFGCAVAQGTAERGGKPLDAANNVVIGINVFNFNHSPGGVAGSSDVDTVGLMQYGGGQLGRKGRFLVPIADGVTIAVGERAFALFESDGGTNTRPGVWSNAQAGGHYIDLTKVGVFKSAVFAANTATGGSVNVAVLEVDFTNKP